MRDESRRPEATGFAEDDRLGTSSGQSNRTVDLAHIGLNDGARPKGYVPYNPTKLTKVRHDRILELFGRYARAGGLPMGPRSVGYRFKETYVGEYAKRHFPIINNSMTRMLQAGTLSPSWVSDAAAVTYLDQTWRDLAGFLRDAPEFYVRDRTEGQPVVVEVYNEARETAALIRQVCAERGVTSYSGGGTCGPNLALKVATRAIRRAVDYDQSTLILGLGDFDVPGLKNIMRPHLEHVSAFLHGTGRRNDRLAAVRGEDGEVLVTFDETDASVSFRHLGLTPELALGLLDLAEAEQDRGRIEDYIDSGEDVFTRDADLLDGVQKIELEALDPVELRGMVTTAIDDVLDLDELARVGQAESDEREQLAEDFAELAAGDS